jgi:hypothetical protein
MELGLYDGAYYLAGYAVECALKACIAKDTRRHQFPDKKRVDLSHSHDLIQLIRVAGLEDEHRERVRSDPDFETNWEVVIGQSKAVIADIVRSQRMSCCWRLPTSVMVFLHGQNCTGKY